MPAVPAVPMTMTGMIRCSAIDLALAQLIGASRYSGAIRCPMDVPNHWLAKYIISSASRKFGVARPSSPRNVRP